MKPPRLRARYWQIVFFFARIILSFIFWELILARLGLKAWVRARAKARYARYARRFRAMAIRMGGLMIKVGQFLSSRLDVLPPEITEELADLQDEVPAETFADIRALAEKEFGAPLQDTFAWFDETPMAAASLGQVHRARLLPADAESFGFDAVVVKIQRPFIDQIVEVDLSALRRVGGWLKQYKPISKRADVPALVEEFAAICRDEINYLVEGRNAETFAANFKQDPRVHVPTVIWKKCTNRVLTLENVLAIKISDYGAITAAGIERAEVAVLLLDVYLKQIFEDGFFHADPHPGNLFVTPLDGRDEHGRRKWKLTFIDFGMVGHLPENLRESVRDVVIAVGLRDAARLVQAYKDLNIMLPGTDYSLVEAASAQVFERFWGMKMSELRRIDHAEVMKFGLQFRELMFNMPFQLPENLLMLGRTVAILSGMCTGLDPEFNVWGVLEPYATRLVASDGASGWDAWLDEAINFFQLLAGLPARASRVMTVLERGDLSVQTPMLNRQVMHLEAAVNRLAAGMVFAALLLAGASLHSADAQLGKVLMLASIAPLGWMLFFARGHHPWK